MIAEEERLEEKYEGFMAGKCFLCGGRIYKIRAEWAKRKYCLYQRYPRAAWGYYCPSCKAVHLRYADAQVGYDEIIVLKKDKPVYKLRRLVGNGKEEFSEKWFMEG